MSAPGNRESAESQVPAEWNVGDVILDLYEVKAIHEGGGMGLVYRVFHRGWNMDLAVKSPRQEFFHTERQKEDFTRECETWINLGLHPHIVSCHYVRTLGGIPRVFAEYVEGGSLRDWIDSRKLYEGGPQEALKRVLNIAIQLAWGLHYAHEKGVIHQDVKPANVLMLPDATAKITDFGLAKARVAAGETPSTDRRRSILVSTGGMTPAYCSPEQANRQPLSRKTDIWSWAVSVLEVFAGEVSWQSGVAAPELLKRLAEVRAEGVALPEMPESLQELLQGCLEFDPAKRPKDAGEISRRLTEIYRSQLDEEHTRPEPLAVELQAGALNNKAISLLDLGRPQETEELLEEALRLEPQHLAATYNRGLILWRRARISDDGLVEQLEHARQSHCDDWRADYLLGLVHLERHERSQAAQAFERILEVAGRQPEVTTALVQARRPDGVEVVFQGHSEAVEAACMSRDGRYALSGSRDKTLRLWEVGSGRCVRTFLGHSECVTSVCLSVDGRFALSGSDDKTLRLWELATGRCLHAFTGHTHLVNSVSISEDGRYALSGSDDTTLRLWEVATGQCLRRFKGPFEGVLAVCLSSDGRHALSGGGFRGSISPGHIAGYCPAGTLQLWEVATGECPGNFDGHSGFVTSVCLSRDGSYALSGSRDGTFKLWEVATGQCRRTFRNHSASVTSVCLSHDGRYALSGSADATLRLWDLAAGQRVRIFKGHMESVTSVCLSSDGRHALSGSGDKTLRLWEIGAADWLAPFELAKVARTEEVALITEKCQRLLDEATAAVGRGALGRVAACLREARALPGCQHRPDVVQQWDRLSLVLPHAAFAGGWEERTLAGHTDAVLSLCVSRDGRLALSGSRDMTVRLWELATGQCLRTFTGHPAWVSSVCLSRDARYALSRSFAGHVTIVGLWDVATGQGRRLFAGNGRLANALSMSGDGRFVLSGGEDDPVRLWETATGRCLRTFAAQKAGVDSVCWSGDDRYALSEGSDGTIRLWDVASGGCLRGLKRGHASEVCWSADGRYVLLWSADEGLRLWEVATGRCLRASGGNTAPVHSARLSGDGRYVVSGGLQLWEVATGHRLRTFAEPTQSVHSVCLSGDGRYAVSGSEDGTLKVWHLDWELEDREPADWDDGAKPYLEAFLTAQVPYAACVPPAGTPSEAQITEALTHRGKPAWEPQDFERLLHDLSCADYGWLRPEGVRRKLEEMASQIQPASRPKSIWDRLFRG